MPARKSTPKKARSPKAAAGRAAAEGNGLNSFSMHASDAASAPMIAAVRKEEAARRSFALTTGPEAAAVDPETVARGYLQQALASKSVAAFTAPKAGDTVSEFKSLGTETIPLTGTRTVKFRQTLSTIPIYGSLVTVELDDDNRLISLNSAVGKPSGISPVAKVSPADAARAVKDYPGYRKNLDGVVPRLNYYFDKRTSKWRLVFFFEDVRVTPEKAKPQAGPAKRLMDYVVDAHNGKVVAQLPRTANLTAKVETVLDGLEVPRRIRVEVNGTRKVLQDSSLNIRTYDFGFRDPETESSRLPGRAIKSPPHWSPTAVSAHANAATVAEFLRQVLRRNNIDNNGGPMNSSINCVAASEAEGDNQWRNAFWNGDQMVYGQILYKGSLLSICVALDIVAHEMFHGVTDATARLEYALQSGALNESYSDIFGVIVANLAKPDIDSWNWKIGENLDTGGKPFRDMSHPARLGQPAHMRHFKRLPNTENGDWGGVHVNSGIHNKAAYLMLTAKVRGGASALTPQEVAAIFYLALTQRLSRTSHFADSRRAVVDSALTLFRKMPVAVQRAKLAAVDDAFDAVGIKGKRARIVNS